MTTSIKPPMEFPQISAQVARLLAQHLDKPLEDLTLRTDTTFTGDLKLDSLSVVEFVLRLEDHFGIEVPDEATEGIRTVEDAVRKVEELLLAQVRAADHSAAPPLPPGWKVNREWTDRNAIPAPSPGSVQSMPWLENLVPKSVSVDKPGFKDAISMPATDDPRDSYQELTVDPSKIATAQVMIRVGGEPLCEVLLGAGHPGEHPCGAKAAGYTADDIAVCSDCTDDDTLAIVRPIKDCSLECLPPQLLDKWTDREAAYPRAPAEVPVMDLRQLAHPAAAVHSQTSAQAPAVVVHSDDPYHDLLTHGSWREALEVLRDTPENDSSYYAHEIAALDRLAAFHRELVGKPEEEQVRELVELFRAAPITNHPTVSEQWAKLLLSRYRLVPRKAI
jgi:acyl carrier protein